MKKNILIFGGMLVLLIGLSQMVSANPTCTINVPASNTAYNGTINVNISITNNGTGDYNITGFNMSTTADTDFTNCIGSENASSYQCSANTATLITEVKQTTVTADILVNNTGITGVIKNGSCTSTGVDFDNTNPVCSQLIDFEQIDILKPLTVDCSDSTDTTDITYSVVLTLEDATTSTETPTDGIAIFEQGQTGVLGWATAQCTVTDEVTKSTACTSNSIWIGSEEPTTPPPDIVTTPPNEEKDNMIIFLIAGVALIIVIIILVVIFATKKKGKRR